MYILCFLSVSILSMHDLGTMCPVWVLCKLQGPVSHLGSTLSSGLLHASLGRALGAKHVHPRALPFSELSPAPLCSAVWGTRDDPLRSQKASQMSPAQHSQQPVRRFRHSPLGGYWGLFLLSPRTLPEFPVNRSIARVIAYLLREMNSRTAWFISKKSGLLEFTFERIY